MELKNQIDFTLNTKAISAGRPQVYKNGGVGDAPSYRKFKNEVEAVMIKDIGEERINQIIEKFQEGTGYQVKMTCYYKVVNSNFWNTPMITRPDVDNVAKALLDQILGRLGIDDSRVFNLTIEKLYAKENRIKCSINTYSIEKYYGYKKSNERKERKSKKKKPKNKYEKIVEDDEVFEKYMAHYEEVFGNGKTD